MLGNQTMHETVFEIRKKKQEEAEKDLKALKSMKTKVGKSVKGKGRPMMQLQR